MNVTIPYRSSRTSQMATRQISRVLPYARNPQAPVRTQLLSQRRAAPSTDMTRDTGAPSTRASETRHLQLSRPLVAFDLETTGFSRQYDQIIEFGAVKRFADGRPDEARLMRFRPTCPISPFATQAHGISAADLREEPLFSSQAAEIGAFLDDCDLLGHNLKRFDIPMLGVALGRQLGKTHKVDFIWPSPHVYVLDSLELFRALVPDKEAAGGNHKLGTCYTYFLKKPLLNAHNALADAEACMRVVDAMVAPDAGPEAQAARYKTVAQLETLALASRALATRPRRLRVQSTAAAQVTEALLSPVWPARLPGGGAAACAAVDAEPGAHVPSATRVARRNPGRSNRAALGQHASEADDAFGARGRGHGEAPHRAHLPRDGEYGHWTGLRGQSGWVSQLPGVQAITAGASILFRNNFPDFRPYAQLVFYNLALNGSHDDFRLADAFLVTARPQLNLTDAQSAANYRQTQGLTWHHHEDALTLLLMPRALHEAIPHAGGASLLRQRQRSPSPEKCVRSPSQEDDIPDFDPLPPPFLVKSSASGAASTPERLPAPVARRASVRCKSKAS